MILPMTDGEIRAMYRDAKEKRAQIQILADLNATDTDTIRDILRQEPNMLPGAKPRKQPVADEPVKTTLHRPQVPDKGQQASKPVQVTQRLAVPEGTPLTKAPLPPECVMVLVRDRIKTINKLIKEREEDLGILNDNLNRLKAERDELREYIKD